MNFNFGESLNSYSKPYKLQSERALIISDVHVPFYDKKALILALQRLSDVDTLIINGDFVDFYQLSRFSKVPGLAPIKDELEISFDILSQIRNQFKGKILYKIGNHEDRLQTYLNNVAPALAQVESLSFRRMMKFDELDITLIDSAQIIKLGELNIIHAHETKVGGGINVARTMFLKTSQNTLFGHFHRTQEYINKDINGNITGCWAVGCLCNLNADYMPVNNWNSGFAIVENNKHTFRVNNYKIFNGKVL